MSGIALMLDGVIDAVEEDRIDEAKQVLGSALEKQRQTIRSLRDLSFELEPVVLRDQGFGPAVSALAEQLGMSNSIQIDLEVDAAEAPDRARSGGDLPDHPRGAAPGDQARAADANLGPRRPKSRTGFEAVISGRRTRASGAGRATRRSPSGRAPSTGG